MRMSKDEVINWFQTFLPEQTGMVTAIRKMDDFPFKHPYFWAGFYAAGDI